MIPCMLLDMDEQPPGQRIDSVFHRTPRRRRSPPALSRDRIVTATITLLDREGSSALTMRRVAAELGVHATSLYWYVERREDLVDLAVDEVLAGAAAAPPATDLPWDTAVRETARRFYAALTEHTWAAEFAGSRPLVGPNAVALSRRIIEALGELGGGEERRAVAIRAISNQILGAATSAVAMRVAKEGRADEHGGALATAVSEADTLAVEHTFFDQALDLVLLGIRTSEEA